MGVRLVFLLLVFLFTHQLSKSENAAAQDILRRIEELENRDRFQQFEINTLRQENTAMASEIIELREQELQQGKRVTTLEERVKKMATQTVVKFERALTNDTERNEKTDIKSNPVTQTIAAEVDTQQEKHNQSNDELYDSKDNTGTVQIPHQSKNRIRQIQDQAPIAFFATVSDNQYHLGLNQPVIFDNAITNIGQALQVSSGIFNTPVSGIYVFSTSIIVHGQAAHFEFTVNGKFASKLFVQAATGRFQTTSQTVIFNLNQGDDVAVRYVDTDNWIHGYHYSTFSGFLLSQSS